jgi:hypothetical protein
MEDLDVFYLNKNSPTELKILFYYINKHKLLVAKIHLAVVNIIDKLFIGIMLFNANYVVNCVTILYLVYAVYYRVYKKSFPENLRILTQVVALITIL